MSFRVKTTIPVAAALVLALAPAAYAQATAPSQSGLVANDPSGHYHEGELGEKLMIVETSLKCQCGCGLDVHSCQFQMQCGESPVWSRRIREALERGETVEAIQASFVADFGTEVLMLPPAEGFNVLGYILPALAIVTAGMFVGVLARGNATRAALTPTAELSDVEADRLRAAMAKLDEEESPDW